MALIKCPECGRENVSEHADACPNCGFPIAELINNKTNSIQPEIVINQPSQNGFTEKVETKSINSFNEKYMTKKQSSKSRFPVILIICSVCVILFGYIFYSDTRCDYPGCDKKKMSSSDYCINHYSKIARNSFGYTGYGDNDYKSHSSYTSVNTTTGNEGALNKAKSYLRHSAFSYSGLIDQLEYEGFSQTEAKYGADNCGADWYEQAVLKANSYLNSSSFSYSGLIDQLVYEGFSEDEAKYGVDKCGADWYEQAIKKAKSYRKSTHLSGDELVDQLIYEGFTSDQAEYGANNSN